MISLMFRCFVLCLFGVWLVTAIGCQLNRTLAPLALGPSSERGRLGIAALERGDLNEAERRLEDAVRLNKNDINHRRYYAEVLWQQGKHQEALQQLDEAIKRGGQNSDALYISLAEKYLVLREYTTAHRYADEAVRLNPQDARCWALRGRAKRLQSIHQAGYAEHSAEMLRQAREDYLQAVSLSPSDRELLAELAAIQMSCGQPEQALATWLTIQSLYSQNSEPTEVLIGKTETLLALRRFDEAETNLTLLRQRGLENSEEGRRLQGMFMAARGEIRR